MYSTYFQQTALPIPWGVRRRPPGEWLSNIQRRADRGGINWGDMYDQWGHDIGAGDLLDRLLDAQHMLSPMRAPLSHEPTMRQQFGAPDIGDYGRLRVPGNRIPIDWMIRQIAPRWGDTDDRPRPGGAPSGLYDFPVVG